MNKVDTFYWPSSALNTHAKTNADYLKNFKLLMAGIEKYYSQKLESVVNIGNINLN
jgi:hypothetical protein